MFTGIVQRKAKILDVVKQAQLRTLEVELPQNAQQGLNIGASIANNGTCLTVVKKAENSVFFDVIEETLKVTNLSKLEAGDFVNLERATKFGDEIGGHMLSGHVHTQATVVKRDESSDNCTLSFSLNEQYQKYIFAKGFISINGISLTLSADVDEHFSVHLIPETLEMTTFKKSTEGDYVNLEIDSQTQSIVDTVSRVLEEQKEI